jgi:hypothetical protein
MKTLSMLRLERLAFEVQFICCLRSVKETYFTVVNCQRKSDFFTAGNLCDRLPRENQNRK